MPDKKVSAADDAFQALNRIKKKVKQDDRIDLILSWADEHPDFDTAFVDSMAEKLETYGELTEAQSDALDNIIERWRIE